MDLRPTLEHYQLATKLTVAALDPDGADQFPGILREIARAGSAVQVLLASADRTANACIMLTSYQQPDLEPGQARTQALADARQGLAGLTAETETDEPPAPSA